MKRPSHKGDNLYFSFFTKMRNNLDSKLCLPVWIAAVCTFENKGFVPEETQ